MLILLLMTALTRKRSGRPKKREKYYGIKSSKMLECLEQETERRRNRCRTFKDLTPVDRPQFSPPLIQSVQISPVGAAIVQATTQGFARPLYLPGPTVFPALPNQGTSQTLSTFNTSCHSDVSQVSCVKEVSSNSCPRQGQIDSELRSNIFAEVLSPQSPSVKNRLSENISFWEKMGASPWVLKILREGYSLPFVQQPPQVSFRNNKSALEASEFVTSEIYSLLEQGCIREVRRSETHVISPLSVVHNSSKPRLILDLSYLNQFISVPKFKYEDIRCVRDLFEKGDYFFKFDIKSGYHHINILEAHQKYLAFAWDFEGVTKYFVFTVLVFGLASAPFVFTKVVNILIKYWRASGIRIFGYVDDVFGGGHTFKETEQISQRVRKDLFDSGFVENTKKSQWEPVQEGQHLGFIVNLKEGSFSVIPSRIDKFKSLLSSVSYNSMTARSVARIVGTIVSMALALGPVSRMRTRMLYMDINKASFWDQKIKLSEGAKDELRFWNSCLHQFNGQPIWPASIKISVLTYADASQYGWGGYCVNLSGVCAKGTFQESEIGRSSTWRELLASYHVLKAYKNFISGKTVKHTDNRNVVYVLSSGSKKLDLQGLVCDIFKLCFENNIQLYPEWIPRSNNLILDHFSKDIDKDDYMLNPEIFAAADVRWGPHSIDRFSSFRTRQIPRFCSHWLNPCMEYLDAFTASWNNENNWLFPPPYIIPRVLKHLKSSSADATLVAPLWRSAPWWPLLTYDGVFFRHEVRLFYNRPTGKYVYPGCSRNYTFWTRHS